jgi:hypothetical protein
VVRARAVAADIGLEGGAVLADVMKRTRHLRGWTSPENLGGTGRSLTDPTKMEGQRLPICYWAIAQGMSINFGVADAHGVSSPP